MTGVGWPLRRRQRPFSRSPYQLPSALGHAGTGKTTTVVEAVLQEVARGSRVLCTAASNVATDNLAERLACADPRLRLVRVGHAARLHDAVLSCSLDALVSRSDSSRLAADCRAEAGALAARLLKLAPWKRAERRDIQSEMRRLGREERARQNKAAAEVLSRAQVRRTPPTARSTCSAPCCTKARPLSLRQHVIDLCPCEQRLGRLHAEYPCSCGPAGRLLYAHRRPLVPLARRPLRRRVRRRGRASA